MQNKMEVFEGQRKRTEGDEQKRGKKWGTIVRVLTMAFHGSDRVFNPIHY